MKAPSFWWRPPRLAAFTLAPASLVYGGIAARRMAQPGTRAAVPVICVGNVTVGGSGKTPVALALTRLLRGIGRRPAFLTRGYGGRLPGPVTVNTGAHTAADVGDEALLLARVGPTVVARDRVAGAARAIEGGADVIVMDDGLQNPALVKSLSFAVFDAAVGIGNGFCLPAGPLRARLAAQWGRIDAVILVGAGAPGEAIARDAKAEGVPVIRADLGPDPAGAAGIAGGRFLAFAGIGRPAKFFDTLQACGAAHVESQAFADHHAFTRTELAALVARAERSGLRLITTEKDAVRLTPLVRAEPQLAVFETLPVRLTFVEPDAVTDLLAAAIAAPA
jgi:tetraacyldisaccharide 4'-kinase